MSSINLKALIQKLNPTCQQTLESAAGMCISRSHYNVEIEHWFLKLLEQTDNDLAFIFSYYDINTSHLSRDLIINLEHLKTGNAQSPALSQRIIDLAREALLLATLEYSAERIRSAYLLYALIHEENLNRIARSLSPEFTKISADSLRAAIPQLIKESRESDIASNETEKSSTQQNIKTPALNQFTINLTELARQGKIDEVVGRDAEIRQIIDILTRRRQNNPILTGEPGVGKTAVVEGFALKIAKCEVPPSLQNVAVHTLDLGLLQAGASVKGEFENRLKAVIKEVKASPHPIILFIDEAHTLVGAGAQAGQGDAANLLKPALARGELRTIAATTWGEYKKYFEQDAALTRRFQIIKIEEPPEEIAITMLRSLITHLEKHHHVRILDEAVIAAVRLSNRYLSNRQLPDKAISVLDTACARLNISDSTLAPIIEYYQQQLAHLETEIAILKREIANGTSHNKRMNELLKQKRECEAMLTSLKARWQNEKELIKKIRKLRHELENSEKIDKTVLIKRKELQSLIKQLRKMQGETPLLQDCIDEQAIADVISTWTGIPLGRMVNNDVKAILNLEERLQKRIIGQAHALKIITQSIQTSRARLTDPRKPIGIFLLLGPSGVGKTETALALADLLYGGEQNMTTINLSEFKEEHKVSLLLGSPPGYVGYGEGGILTEAVRRYPYSLVLLDEVEKAHPGVQDIFYQVFDKGILRDGQGRDINFKNTVIILTSNIGSELITKLCSDPQTMPNSEALLETLKPELLKFFKPAFLGRMTIIPYLALTNKLFQQIVVLQLQRIQRRVNENYRVNLNYDHSLIEHIAEKSKESPIGARSIEHLLTRSLLPELSTRFLERMVNNQKITHVTVGLNTDGQFTYTFII